MPEIKKQGSPDIGPLKYEDLVFSKPLLNNRLSSLFCEVT
jgi:hypothetical protein